MTLGTRYAAEASERLSIYPGRTCGFAAEISVSLTDPKSRRATDSTWRRTGPAIEVLIAHPPVPELLRHLSTMTTGELLQSDLTGRAKFVGANDRLPTDERAEIDTR